jgi:predicted small metal-binding protein
MAKTDDRLKITSCPICGYTDTASDPEALYSAIEEHVRMAHNMDLNTLNTETEVKPTDQVVDDRVAEVPLVPPPGQIGQRMQ